MCVCIWERPDTDGLTARTVDTRGSHATRKSTQTDRPGPPAAATRTAAVTAEVDLFVMRLLYLGTSGYRPLTTHIERPQRSPPNITNGRPWSAILVEMADKPVTLSALPAELHAEISTRVQLRNFRLVFRFDVRWAACVRLQRWFRAAREQLHARNARIRVGDRVLVKRASSSITSALDSTGRFQYATAAAQLEGRQHMWKLMLLTGTYAHVHGSRVRRLSDWADGPWSDTVGRSSALASASAARAAAAQAASAAIAVVRSGVSSAQAALAIAAATTASTAAVAATAASSAVSPTALQTGEERQAQQAEELLVAVQQMHEVLIASDAPGAVPVLLHDDSLSLLSQATDAAIQAAAEAGAAASAAEAVQSVGSLPVTALTAATAASAAEQLMTAVEELVTGMPAPTTAPAAMGAPSVRPPIPPSVVTAQAAVVAADALADLGVAGRALTSVLGSLPGGSASAALEGFQQAGKVLLPAVLQGAAYSDLSAAGPMQPRHQWSKPCASVCDAGTSCGVACEPIPTDADADSTAAGVAGEPRYVAMPDRDMVVAFLCRANPTQYGPGGSSGASRRPTGTAAQNTALTDAVNGIMMQLTSAAVGSPKGMLPSDACPLLWASEDPRNVWAFEGRLYATQRSIELPLARATVAVKQGWRGHEEEVQAIEGHATAGVVWDGGVVLADLLCQPHQVLLSHSPLLARRIGAYSQWSWAEKTVVELGCGIAPLPSLSAGLQGARRILSTDGNPAVLLKTRANVSTWTRQHPHATMPTVAELQWGADAHVLEQLRALGVPAPVDVILAADCIYVLDNPGAWGKLLSTVAALSSAHTLTFVTYTERGHDRMWRRFLDERVGKRFHVVPVAAHLLHPTAHPGAAGRLEQFTPRVQVYCWTLRAS